MRIPARWIEYSQTKAAITTAKQPHRIAVTIRFGTAPARASLAEGIVCVVNIHSVYSGSHAGFRLRISRRRETELIES